MPFYSKFILIFAAQISLFTFNHVKQLITYQNMNKNITHLRWLVTTLMLVTAMAMPSMASAAITPSKPANGDGTSSDPYQISNAAELYWFAELVNGKLTDGTAQNVAACAKLWERED